MNHENFPVIDATNHKHSCVIDATGNYITYVLVADDEIKEYQLKADESLIDAPTPSGFMKPHWDGETWVETASLEEIAAADTRTLEEVAASKIAGLSSACNATIINGTSITLSDGSIQHFTYDERDQLNIFEMFNAAILGATCYPYQAVNGSCTIYMVADIIAIYTTLAGLKTAQITYYHALKDYVESLSSKAEIGAVTYGQPLVGTYLTHYAEMMAAAQQQMQTIIARIRGAV